MSLKWLSLDLIKQHLRLDPINTIEDDLLLAYAEAAEDTVLNICGRSYDNLVQVYGDVPMPVIQASLVLVDASYQYRSPVSPTSISTVPYTFDMLIKPYMKLA